MRCKQLAHDGDARQSGPWGYLVLRACLGVNIGMHGLVRLSIGSGIFAGATARQFHGTLLPHWSVLAFGYTLPWVEAIVGVLVLFGLWIRVALIAGGTTIAILTFGITLVQQWEIAGTQLIYAAVIGFLLMFLNLNRYSIDELMARRKAKQIRLFAESS